MTKQITTHEFIKTIAQRKGFTQGDVKEIYDGIIEVFEEVARNGDVLKLRSFGKLYTTEIPERHISEYVTKDGEERPAMDLPPVNKIIFTLAENIRFNDRRDDE